LIGKVQVGTVFMSKGDNEVPFEFKTEGGSLLEQAVDELDRGVKTRKKGEVTMITSIASAATLVALQCVEVAEAMIKKLSGCACNSGPCWWFTKKIHVVDVFSFVAVRNAWLSFVLLTLIGVGLADRCSSEHLGNLSISHLNLMYWGVDGAAHERKNRTCTGRIRQITKMLEETLAWTSTYKSEEFRWILEIGYAIMTTRLLKLDTKMKALRVKDTKRSTGNESHRPYSIMLCIQEAHNIHVQIKLKLLLDKCKNEEKKIKGLVGKEVSGGEEVGGGKKSAGRFMMGRSGDVDGRLKWISFWKAGHLIYIAMKAGELPITAIPYTNSVTLNAINREPSAELYGKGYVM
ncbi:FKBP-type peptidyl-prolyl cis-trans isomerase domain-containing protein, partial [Tanacetum coccineum]